LCGDISDNEAMILARDEAVNAITVHGQK